MIKISLGNVSLFKEERAGCTERRQVGKKEGTQHGSRILPEQKNMKVDRLFAAYLDLFEDFTVRRIQEHPVYRES